MESTFEILIILGLILFNGFFSGAEIAVLTARRNRLQQAASSGHRGAKAALKLLANTNQFLSTVQVGITGVGTFAAAYGGVSLVEQLGEQLVTSRYTFIADNGKGIALALVTSGIAFVSLVLGELVPKSIALTYTERLATFVAIPMLALSVAARPIVAVLGYVTSAILAALRVKPEGEARVSVDDIEHLLETGKSQGLLDEAEHGMALESLRLRNRRVRDVMRPRIDVDAVDVDTPAEEVVGVVAMSGFSRLPVYEGDLDHIVGFLYNKDVFQQSYLKHATDLRRMLRQPLFIPDTLTLDRLLLLFRERRTQLAIVLDEFGGTRGMVTIEDVLEELVGEIHDEHRRDEEHMLVQRNERSWLIDGLLPLHELREALPPGTRLTEAVKSASTASGLVLASLEEVPKVGDVAECGDVTLEVVDMDGVRIDRVLVTLRDPEAHG